MGGGLFSNVLCLLSACTNLSKFGGPNALLAPSNENLGGPVPLVSTGSGPHATILNNGMKYFAICFISLFFLKIYI